MAARPTFGDEWVEVACLQRTALAEAIQLRRDGHHNLPSGQAGHPGVERCGIVTP